MLKNIFAEKIHGSIDIGSKYIRALTISKGKVRKIVQREIPDSVEDAEINEVRLEEALGEVVEKLKLKGKNIVVSLASQKFYSKFIKIEVEDEDDDDRRQEKIYDELEDLIPNYDPLDFITETIKLKSLDGSEELLAIFIEREKLELLQNIMNGLKVKVVKLVPDYISCYNILELKIIMDRKNRYSGIIGIIDLGYEGTKIYFVDENGLRVYLNTQIGSKAFSETIRRYKDLGYDDVEEIKRNIELGDKYHDSTEEVGMYKMLTEEFEELEKNIEMAIDFFSKKNLTSNIKSFLLVGGGSLLKGFREHLQKKLGIRVEYISYDDLGLDEIDLMLEDNHPVEVANLLGNIINEVI